MSFKPQYMHNNICQCCKRY